MGKKWYSSSGQGVLPYRKKWERLSPPDSPKEARMRFSFEEYLLSKKHIFDEVHVDSSFTYILYVATSARYQHTYMEDVIVVCIARLSEWVKNNFTKVYEDKLYVLDNIDAIPSTLAIHKLKEDKREFTGEANIHISVSNILESRNGMTCAYILHSDKPLTLEQLRKFLPKVPDEEFEVREFSFERIFIDPVVKEDLLSDIYGFLKAKDIYQKKLKLPWKRGYLLHGAPGNGKTLFIRTLAADLDFDILDVDDLIDNHGSTPQLRMPVTRNRPPRLDFYGEDLDKDKDKPSLVVLEDLEKLFNLQGSSDEIGHGGSYPLRTILSALDNVCDPSGTIYFATTNNIESIADSILRRPGRFDRVIEIKNPEVAQIAAMMRHHELSDDIIKEFAPKFRRHNLSMAFVEESIKVCKTRKLDNNISITEFSEVFTRLLEHDAVKENGKSHTGFGFGS